MPKQDPAHPHLSIPLLKYFWRYLKPDKSALVLSFFGMVLMAAFSVLVTMVPTILERHWHPGMRHTLYLYIGGIFVINLIVMVVQSGVNWTMTNVTENVVRRVKLAILAKVGLLPCEDMTYEAIGKFAQRTTGDVMRLGGLVYPNLLQLLFSMAQLVFMLGALFWIDYRFAGLLPVVVLFVWIIVKRINERVNNWARKDQLKQEDVLTLFIESIGGSRDLVASGRFGNAVEAYDKELAKKQHFQVMASWWNNLGGMVPTACFSALIFGYYLTKIATTDFADGGHEVGPILSYAANLGMAQGLVLSLFRISTDTALATPSLFELHRMLEAPEVVDQGNASQIASGEITLENVKFAYGVKPQQAAPQETLAAGASALSETALDNAQKDSQLKPADIPEDKLILHGISLTIKPGSFAAIVGQSGSGKSTIFYILLRLLEPVSGRVLLGGAALPNIPLAILRNYIGFIPQSPFIFNGTIKENLLMGASADDVPAEKIEYAVKMANLTEFVAKRQAEGGLDAQVGAGGASLSAGERQRIALARIFLRDPGIIVCDEYTANIDNATAKLIHNALKNEFAGKTRVVITHQLYTIRGADEIFVLEKGSIVEHGKHEDLLAKDGLYKEMWEVQHID